MQFINTFEGVKTRCVCKPDQTLFSATTNKNGKKRSGLARLIPYSLNFSLISRFFDQPRKFYPRNICPTLQFNTVLQSTKILSMKLLNS